MSEVQFIGTSDAFGAGGRRQSAVLLRAPGGSVLIDCGATTGSGLHALGIDPDEIESIVVSHFHGDHFGGIPLLLLSALYEQRRTRPLRVAGPRGIESRVRSLASAMSHSLEDRDWTFDLRFEELPAGRRVALGPVEVESFETHHSPDSLPHGLILETGAERIAYSGDTGWFDALPRKVAGSALFICECTYRTDAAQFEYHLNHDLLVETKHQFDCGRIVLTHLGTEMTHLRGQCEFETADDGLELRI